MAISLPTRKTLAVHQLLTTVTEIASPPCGRFAMTTRGRPFSLSYVLCHREERSDVAISLPEFIASCSPLFLANLNA